MRVRDMREEDIGAIELIYKATGGEPDTELFVRRVRSLLDDRLGGVAFVAQKASEPVVGYLLGEIRAWEFGSSRAGWIFALGVDPLYQRQGVGRMLLERARVRFEELGIRALRTLVHQDEAGYIGLFETGGFREASFVVLELPLEEG